MCKWVIFMSSVNHSGILPDFRSAHGNLWPVSGWSEVQVAQDLATSICRATVSLGQAFIVWMWLAPVKAELQLLAGLLFVRCRNFRGRGLSGGRLPWVSPLCYILPCPHPILHFFYLLTAMIGNCVLCHVLRAIMDWRLWDQELQQIFA